MKKGLNFKKLFVVVILASIAMGYISCKKEKDYRDKWVGTYEFTTIDEYRQIPFPIAEPITTRDTIIFIGNIKKHETDRLKIAFMSNAKEPSFEGFNFKISGLIYPVVNKSDNILNYPEFMACTRVHFNGIFSNDTITINYGRFEKTYQSNIYVKGIKINKKERR